MTFDKWDWILSAPDPIPTLQDVRERLREESGQSMLENYEKIRVEETIHKRLLNGPPIRDGMLMVPGYGLPLTHKIHWDSERLGFLYGLGENDWSARTLTNREVCMLKFIEDITNKAEWWLKVRSPEIVAKWREEVLGLPWSKYQRNADFTTEMVDLCILELQKKADIYEKTGLVAVMDYHGCAIKSDTILTPAMMQSLKTAVQVLEQVPDKAKDWHPGSAGKVLDLVHPSLWPLVYSRSRLITDERIPLDECLDYCGSGIVIPKPLVPPIRGEGASGTTWRNQSENSAISEHFQWLPCDVDISGSRPRIESYINNLHPVKHAHLYPIIEDYISISLPAWELVTRSIEPDNGDVIQRLEETNTIQHVCTTPDICGDGDCYPENRPGYEDDDDYDLANSWWAETHKTILPEPLKEPKNLIPHDSDDVRKTGFAETADKKRIQVIVKLANIHLTPERPTYDGGSWHVEGQFNEHICATALFYYDCHNITESRLAFRTKANDDLLQGDFYYQQGDYSGIESVFAVENMESRLQNIGSVLTREGRALFFPNVYQHQVQPFELADKSRPGHRKILALFLVDPDIPILSTANIPPQQSDWWVDQISELPLLNKLPTEMREMVVQNVDFPISWNDAKQIREELMKERTVINTDTENRLSLEEWSFCEH